MTDNGSGTFLRQAHLNNWQRYQESLQPGSAVGWDICILTASDERQASLYRSLLDTRAAAGLLPTRTRFIVVADPNGRRIGSGGATLRALALLPELLKSAQQTQPASAPPTGKTLDPQHARTLIIHSGGDSKRLPHCSATGKLLARIPRALSDGRASTVFDEFLISLSGMAKEVPGGVLVASGDVLLIFDHLQLSLQRGGVIGVAAAAPVAMASRHGVYVTEPASHGVQAYLHKPAASELARWEGIAPDGTVQIDTGLIWFDAASVARLLSLADDHTVAQLCGIEDAQNERIGGLHLYADLLLPLAVSTQWDSYLADTSDGPIGEGVPHARRIIWERMRGIPLSAERLQPAVFAHFGTSHEYWRLTAGDPDIARLCGWTAQAAAWSESEGRATGSEHTEGGPEALRQCVLVNAAMEGVGCGAGQAASQDAVLVCDAYLKGSLRCAGAALVAGIRSEQDLLLERDIVVHQLAVSGGGYVTQVFGLRDDPKQVLGQGATFVNRPWETWLQDARIDPDLLWSGIAPAQRCLWNARLYAIAEEREESLTLALPLQNPALVAAEWRERWVSAQRLSLAENSVQVDVRRILDDIADLEDHIAARRFYAAVAAEESAVAAQILLGADRRRLPARVHKVAAWLACSDSMLQLRGYAALAQATQDGDWSDKAFRTLAEAVQGNPLLPSYREPVHAHPVRSDEGSGGSGAVVRVEAAARIDFGGGWTDTPPYSIERGGTVLNGAITLHGKHPIIVEAERLHEPRLLLHCHDIGAQVELHTVEDALNYSSPSDPFALLKAALVLRGFVPVGSERRASLASVLANGGLSISTQTSIPRGSGLGTSSILAGAVLSCLAHCQGQYLDQQQLFDDVLRLEQMLTTGGGWQDQVGGLVGGVKLITSQPGLPQRLHIAPVPLSPQVDQEFAGRLLLVYTGQQRLAKNLLRNVMGRWMARDTEMVAILREITTLALAMRGALTDNDVAAFGRLLGEHWAINKRMDPGCSNAFIDDLFQTMVPFICGGKLAGAGGGGFAMVVAHDVEAAGHLASALARRYAGAPVAIWPCWIAAEGVRVSRNRQYAIEEMKA